MSESDERREASDPVTPGERLRELLGKHRPDDWYDRRSVEAANPLVLAAVLRNQHLPPDDLRVVLLRRQHPPARNYMAAWYNPLVEVLLLNEPPMEYRVGALRLLRDLERDNDVVELPYCPGEPDDVLLRRVRVWAAQDEQTSPALAEIKVLVRRIASLFGLPWPTSSSAPSSPASK